ncbi:Signal transduction histidine kinase [Duganella sp. CF517]|uniref:ATP-binding protein n=1 Tax=Duganella sp. CF517 TaxID=1881038 RepID=UPI0008D46509|nr:ATP-binding protein [Duganella sp. CF517]SEO05036.1 Signal transduction histidine kinase [Duganella sp. CF517]
MAWPGATLATVRARLIAMALATTAAALLLCTCAMLFYDLSTFQRSWIDDMRTQAELLALSSAPAINFNDAPAARKNLDMLRMRPEILAGAIYNSGGAMFASYTQSALRTPVFLDRPGPLGHQIVNGSLTLYHPIVEHGERIGTVYLEARYRIGERIASYGSILAAVMLCSLLLAALVASRLQRSITAPLEGVTSAARAVIQRRDFSLRVPGSAPGEIGTLVDAFNAMLAEVEKSASGLLATNATLEREMAVRQEAERALRIADRRKDEFLATLAHELRNPLAPIRTGLDIMRINPSDLGASGRARDIMERQLRQMVRLVDDLLDVSRINTGKLTIKRDLVDLRQVIHDAFEIVRPLVEQQGHVLTAAPLAQPLPIEGDATRLTQILSNLLNNAAKYTARGGRIAVDVELEQQRVRVHVRDNGIGIAPEMREAVFQMFVQADASLERTTAGLGVGLSLARRLAELHGGELSLHSIGLGYGSEFVLTLPLPRHGGGPPAAPDHAADAGATAGPAASAGRGRRILLADDNIDFVNSMGALLESRGHVVSVAYDGQGALDNAAAFMPEFAFLDIGLPSLNGYDLARALRALPALRHTALVAVTGWGQQKDRDLAKAAGFDAHLVKPVSFDQIEAMLTAKTPGVSADIRTN